MIYCRLHATAIVLLAVTFAGCQQKGPQQKDPYVTNIGGRGTAHVAGINFEVANTSTGDAGHKVNAKSTSSPPKEFGQHEITLGNVKIMIVKGSDDTAWKLSVNGKAYGTVQSGDRVSITETRDVNVNGQTRSAEADDKEANGNEN